MAKLKRWVRLLAPVPIVYGAFSLVATLPHSLWVSAVVALLLGPCLGQYWLRWGVQ